MRNFDDARFFDRRMLLKNFFNQSRINADAADLNHPFLAQLKEDEAVFRHTADVARVNPRMAVFVFAQRSGSLLRFIQIIEHIGRSADAQLAVDAVGQFRLCSRFDDFCQNVGARNSDGTDFLVAVGVNGTRRRAFGQSLAFADNFCAFCFFPRNVEFVF